MIRASIVAAVLMATSVDAAAVEKTVLKPGEKMMDMHDEVEETEDGQKIKVHLFVYCCSECN